MERMDKIRNHPLWKESLTQIEKLEADRIFCKHDTVHFLDVARIAYIEILEKHLDIPKAWVYAAALLHDIGRHLQYTQGIPHEKAGAELAEVILKDCGFAEAEWGPILRAIDSHREKGTAQADDLAGVIYRADKASRSCMFCHAAEECNWSDEKKNLSLSV